MKALKIILLVLLLLLLVAAGWVYQAGLGLERTAFNRGYYRGLLEKTGLAVLLHESIMESIRAEMPREIPDAVRDPLIEALAAGISPAWLDQQIEANAGVFLDFLDGHQEDLTLSFDFDGPKAALIDELESLLAGLGLAQLPVPSLGPDAAGRLVDQLMEQFELPGSILLPSLAETHPEALRTLERIKQYRRHFRVTPYIFFGVAALFCFLLAGLPGGLKWFGGAALLSGASFSLGLLAVRFFAVLPAGVSHSFAALGDAVLGDAARLFTASVRYTVDQLLLVAAVYAAAGLALVIAGMVLSAAWRASR